MTFNHLEDLESISGFLPPYCPYPESDSSTTDLRSYDEKSSAPPPPQTSNQAPVGSLTLHRRSDDPTKGSAKRRRKAFEKIQTERRRREALELEAAKEDEVTRQIAARVSDIQGAREAFVTPMKSTSTRIPRTPAMQTPSTREGRKASFRDFFESTKEEEDRRHQNMIGHTSSLCKKGMDHTTACHNKTDKLISDGQTKSERRLCNLERGMKTLLSQTQTQSKPEYISCSTTADTTSMGTESDRMLALEKENTRLNGIIKKRLGYEPKRRR